MAAAENYQARLQTLDFPEELKQRAREFWAKAAEVAYTLNYDYAIELYLDGLNFWPDAVEQGHAKLREIALQRQAAGHKKSGLGDKSKWKKGLGKGSRDDMLKAEYQLSKDPSNTSHMAAVIKAALEGNFNQTAFWFCDVMLDAILKSAKPSWKDYVFLRDAYSKLEVYPRALQACQLALQLRPNDDDLKQAVQDLATQATMQRGNYDSAEDFRDSIKDRETQEKLHSQEEVHGQRAVSARQQLLAQAKAEYQADPNLPGKIDKYVKALTAGDDPEQEKVAIDVLEKAYQELGQFRFKQRAGEIRLRQASRVLRKYRQALQKDPDNDDLRRKYAQAMRAGLAAELEHYRLSVENFPTDMTLKLEYGKRLVRAKQYDEAIPLFQEARRDPRLRTAALNCLGQAWFYKQWYPDAIETFQEALDAMENTEDNAAKELRYNLGRAYEADGNITEALNSFRRVAQIDFNYRDVKERVDALRKQQNDNAS